MESGEAQKSNYHSLEVTRVGLGEAVRSKRSLRSSFGRGKQRARDVHPGQRSKGGGSNLPGRGGGSYGLKTLDTTGDRGRKVQSTGGV